MKSASQGRSRELAITDIQAELSNVSSISFESSKESEEEDHHQHLPTLLMPPIRSRSSSTHSAHNFYCSSDTSSEDHSSFPSSSHRELFTSAHTPAGSLIMNLGGKLKSLVNRREGPTNLGGHMNQGRRASTEVFSSIPSMPETTLASEVYDGSQQVNLTVTRPLGVDDSSRSSPALHEPPSPSRTTFSDTQELSTEPNATTRLTFRIRSSSEARLKKRQAMYEDRS